MNERIERMRAAVREGAHRRLRQPSGISVLDECESVRLSWPRRAALLARRQCEAEQVVIEPDQRIVFTRTLPAVPGLYSTAAFAAMAAGRTLHEGEPGLINNLTPDWAMLLAEGLEGRRRAALATRARNPDPDVQEAMDCAIETIDAVEALAGRYAVEARRLGRIDVAETLEWVPAHGARTFREALQSLRILSAVAWLTGAYQIGFGRLDQYLWPFLAADLEAARLDEASAEELLAEFFIALNRDSDLYPGAQQGDNGQSVMLGGVRPDGSDAVNPLTWMALRVARDLALIDPKINLRITPRTDLELLALATELTSRGLGFPQYSNDEVVVPALIAHGYAPEDARDYTVAACWEFVIPGRGMEVVNIGAVSFPYAADVAIRTGLAAGEDFEGILARTAADIAAQTNALADAYDALLVGPSPYLSVLVRDCLESGQDLSRGGRYNNFGVHGAGSANAADALAAVRHLVFETGTVTAADLIGALDGNYESAEPLRRMLAEQGPKVGNNDPRADELLVWLYDRFADACEARGTNSLGGTLRPGTGSAMYYVWLARGQEGMREPVVGATAEGRRRGDPFGANLAPSQGARVRGPFSMLQSFAKIDYQRICNGGPVTMELSDAVFRDADAIRKTAMLVRTFAQLGCQQLQLNTLNRDRLLDAQAHPERHRDLIVRVWGWSGYFCELSPEYQDQIIARNMFGAA